VPEPELLLLDEELLLAPLEDDEPPELEDELPLLLLLLLLLELELVTGSLLLLWSLLQAATVRHEIAASKLRRSVEWRMGSVLIQRVTFRNDSYSVTMVSGRNVALARLGFRDTRHTFHDAAAGYIESTGVRAPAGTSPFSGVPGASARGSISARNCTARRSSD
jgi:hypothetical protein